MTIDAADPPIDPADPHGEAPRPARRPRYGGTHPQQFREKYKELHPDDYPDEVARVVAAGRTPAGTHRPICVDEILSALAPRPGEVAVDATLGYGGHALHLLPRLLPGGRLLGLDTDATELARTTARFRAAGLDADQFTTTHTNYAALPLVLAANGLERVDIVLADLGCSSMQLDDPRRGFSYKREGPLDLRMNQTKGRPASTLLQALPEDRLAAVLTDNADEPHAEAIARAIVRTRSAHPLLTTTDLARVVREALAGTVTDPARVNGNLARVFQALRIEINGEYSALQNFLRVLPDCLSSGGRVAILSFHSGEDRRVKHAFRSGLAAGIYSSAAKQPVRATLDEIGSNPRAGSAKLRWATRA